MNKTVAVSFNVELVTGITISVKDVVTVSNIDFISDANKTIIRALVEKINSQNGIFSGGGFIFKNGIVKIFSPEII